MPGLTDSIEKAVGLLKKLVVGIAAMVAVPQHTIMRRGVPAIWRIVLDLFRIGKAELVHAYVRAEIWFRTHGARFVKFVFWTFLTCLGAIALGIWLKSHGHHDAGYVTGLAGAIALQFLLLLVYVVGDALVYVLVIHLGMAKGALKAISAIVEKVSLGTLTAADLAVTIPAEEQAKAKSLHRKYKDGFAILVLISFALMPVEVFMSWTSVGWTIFLIALALPAVWATVHLAEEFGAIIRVIRKISLYVAIFFVGKFLAEMLLRKSLGSWGFGSIDQWLSEQNATRAVIMLAAAVALGMLIVSLRAADEKKALKWRNAAKGFAKGSAIVILVLMWTGPLSFKDATGHDAPKIKSPLKLFKSDKGDEVASGTGAAPTQVPKNAAFLSPPDQAAADFKAMAGATTRDLPTTPPRATTRSLPPVPTRKKVETVGAAIEALDSL